MATASWCDSLPRGNLAFGPSGPLASISLGMVL